MTLIDIASRFRIPSPTSVEPFGTGLLHATYRVATADGAFVLQRLSAAISNDAVESARIVGAFLASRGVEAPVPTPANHGGALVRAGGDRWRCYPLIAGEAFDVVADPAMAREAGRLVGRMHRHLRDLDHDPRGSIPHFHDTAFIIQELHSVAARLPASGQGIARRLADELPALVVDERAAGEPAMVIHGDLKISNVLFAGGRAVAVIDLDTLMRHFRVIDVGDAFRSWCATGPEDDPGLDFDADLFTAAVDGYAGGVGERGDARLFLRATQQIAWELSARFLIDVVRDGYFGFDAKRYPSRRAHNLARAQAQFRLGEAVASLRRSV